MVKKTDTIYCDACEKKIRVNHPEWICAMQGIGRAIWDIGETWNATPVRSKAGNGWERQDFCGTTCLLKHLDRQHAEKNDDLQSQYYRHTSRLDQYGRPL